MNQIQEQCEALMDKLELTLLDLDDPTKTEMEKQKICKTLCRLNKKLQHLKKTYPEFLNETTPEQNRN